jgi:7-cyano-7-deazaguanine reductase
MANTRDYTQGLQALGRQGGYPARPDRSLLEAFPNPHPGADYSVRFDCPEFTSVCPVTGQPDFGRFSIEFAPEGLCLESKSLKLYLAGYRNEGAFWEDVTNRIADDIFALLKPQWLLVTGEMNPRGGIAITATARRGDAAAAPAG